MQSKTPEKEQRDAAVLMAEEFSARIASGELAPGRKLPTERELSEMYGASRAVIRRGLLLLEKSGSIVRHVGRGTFVAQKQPQGLAAYLPGDVSPADLVAARLVVEPSIAESAAVHATSDDLRIIRECLAKTEQAGDDYEFEYWDNKLHGAIAAAAHNRFLSFITDAVGEVRKTPGWTKATIALGIPSHRQSHSEDHRAIVEALLAREPAAAREAMRAHIRKIMQYLLGGG